VRTPDGAVRHVEEGLVRLDETRWRWTPPQGVEWDRLGVAGSTDLGASAVAVVDQATAPARCSFASAPSPAARPGSVWDHSKLLVEQSVARAAGEAPEMDDARQA
jgi:hypothetical protein